MSYSCSDSMGLLMQNRNNCDYPCLDPNFPFYEELFSGHQSPPYWISESGFTSRHQFDDVPIGENFESEQAYHSSFGYLLNELDSTSYGDVCRDRLFDLHDTYSNGTGYRMENSEDIHHNEDQFDDYNRGSIYLDYESAWECLKSWFGHEDEHVYDWSRQEFKPTYDCRSDDMTLFESILGYWPCLSRVDDDISGHH